MPAKLIKRSLHSLLPVREKLDPNRPKYSEAVKSIAAFCSGRNNPQLLFKVLVTHLDDACDECWYMGNEAPKALVNPWVGMRRRRKNFDR